MKTWERRENGGENTGRAELMTPRARGPGNTGAAEARASAIIIGFAAGRDSLCTLPSMPSPVTAHAFFPTGDPTMKSRTIRAGFAMSSVAVALAVACVMEGVERLPEPQTRAFAGVDLPLLTLDPRPASAVDVVAAALETL